MKNEEKKSACENCVVGIYYDIEDTCVVRESEYRRVKKGESWMLNVCISKFKFCPCCGRRIDWKNEFDEEFEE